MWLEMLIWKGRNSLQPMFTVWTGEVLGPARNLFAMLSEKNKARLLTMLTDTSLSSSADEDTTVVGCLLESLV